MELTYQRADGTIETALSAQDALSRCPVLGRMPLEQAQVLLELAALPAPSAAESETPPPLPSEQVSEVPLVEPQPQAQVFEATARAHAFEKTLRDHLKPLDPVAEIQDFPIVPEPLKPHAERGQVAPVVERPAPEVHPVLHKDTTRQPAAMQPDVVNSPDVPRPDIKLVEKPKPIQPAEADKQPVTPARAIVQQTREALADRKGRTTDVQKAYIVPPLPEIKIETARKKNKAPVVTSKESVEVPLQLAELMELEETDTIPETANKLPLPQSETIEHIEVEQPAISTFEAFVEAQPEPEDPVTMESIQQAVVEEEPPVEETLVKLAWLIETMEETGVEAGVEAEAGPEIEEIKQIIHEISEALQAVTAHAEQTETKPELTPELAEKIIILLKALGYKEPGQALAQMLEKYDLDFVIEALQYLRQLSDSGQRQEFSKTVTAKPADDREESPLHRVMAAFLLTKSIFYSLSN